MQERLKNYALVICLFVFLLVLIGGGLHLTPGGAFLAAMTGTPLGDLCVPRQIRSSSPTKQETTRPCEE